MRHVLPLLVCISAVTACDPADDSSDPVDAADAAFARGKADGATPEDGSPLALAVLRLANTASFETLDDPIAQGGVGLDVRAASGIVERREQAEFEKLFELDAVPYVGPVALSRMITFAVDNGYVEETTTRTGQLAVEIQYRGCNDYPSSAPYCHPWQTRLASTEIEIEDVDGERRIRGNCTSAFGIVEFDEALPRDGEDLVVETYRFDSGSVSDRIQSCIYTPYEDGSVDVVFDWTAYTYSTQSWRQGTAEGTIVFD